MPASTAPPPAAATHEAAPLLAALVQGRRLPRGRFLPDPWPAVLPLPPAPAVPRVA